MNPVRRVFPSKRLNPKKLAPICAVYPRQQAYTALFLEQPWAFLNPSFPRR
jgi:hypothetical protein